MKVLMLQDLAIFPAFGGAQLTDKTHFLDGARRGYQMDVLHPQEIGTTKIADADLVILSNITMFSDELLSYIIRRKPFILFMHDYPCRWRGYFPATDRCALKCKRLNIWHRLFTESKLNIFLSPLHYEMHTILIPEIADHPHLEIPSPIDINLFYPRQSVKRQPNTILWLGPFTRYKGIHLAIAFSQIKKEYAYTFMGSDVDELEDGWGAKLQVLGHKVFPGLPNEDLPGVYSQFEYFLELPAGPMPFERVAAEARCCGCKIITNELLGAASYDWFRHGTVEDVRLHVSRSSKDFWDGIEKYAG
jgi:glycosyltransferase involved in cell wall biosynthesis